MHTVHIWKKKIHKTVFNGSFLQWYLFTGIILFSFSSLAPFQLSVVSAARQGSQSETRLENGHVRMTYDELRNIFLVKNVIKMQNMGPLKTH